MASFFYLSSRRRARSRRAPFSYTNPPPSTDDNGMPDYVPLPEFCKKASDNVVIQHIIFTAWLLAPTVLVAGAITLFLIALRTL